MDFNRLFDDLQRNDQIKAAIVVGSRARLDYPADEYSDIDMVLVSTDPEILLTSDHWLKEAGDFHISFVEDTLMGGKERRVLFQDGTDADFIILSEVQVSAIQRHEADDLFLRGYRVIKDEIDISGVLQALNFTPKAFTAPSEDEFHNSLHDFWFHSVWTAKKLLRGELYTAKSCLDIYMKRLLLHMIELHSRLIDGVADTWYNGRFIEKWADQRIVDQLAFSFAKFNQKDMADALFSTMDAFRSLAVDVAKKQSFAYDRDAENCAYGLVNRLLRSGRPVAAQSEAEKGVTGQEEEQAKNRREHV